jgi:hypothetical protein
MKVTKVRHPGASTNSGSSGAACRGRGSWWGAGAPRSLAAAAEDGAQGGVSNSNPWDGINGRVAARVAQGQGVRAAQGRVAQAAAELVARVDRGLGVRVAQGLGVRAAQGRGGQAAAVLVGRAVQALVELAAGPAVRR